MTKQRASLWLDRIADVIEAILANLVPVAAALFGLALVLFGFAVAGWQAFSWAKTGIYPSVPIASVFHFFEIDLAAIYNPEDWKGLARAAAWLLSLPLSVGSLVLGAVVTFGACMSIERA